jgi:hypothetical protein
MSSHTLALPLIHRRRAFFFSCITQQMRSSSVGPVLLRAAVAVATIAAWGGRIALLAS